MAAGLILAPALVALAAAPGAPPPASTNVDPRPAIVALAAAERLRPALQLTELALATDTPRARALGLGLLRGDLLERLGRNRDAVEAYAQALADDPALAPWARIRLADLQERLGHPEVAAGLVATLLAQGAPESLARPALELMHRTLDTGGDCRLLKGVARERLPSGDRRLRDLMQAECWLRERRGAEAAKMLRELLDADLTDALAWEAALRLSRLPEARDPAVAKRVGLAAFHHREFESALRHLGAGDAPAAGRFDADARTIAYAVARSLFWLGRYDDAARAFAELAQSSTGAGDRADALHQLGRSLELAGRVSEALVAFRRAADTDPTGEWHGAALLATIRLESAQGNDEVARGAANRLLTRPGNESAAGRGALYLAVSDLLRGRTARVRSTLDQAERTREVGLEELGYWRGRLAELEGDGLAAIGRYLAVIERRPFHPLAAAARRRLAQPPLAELARRRGLELAAQGDLRSLYAASTLLGEADPDGRRARQRGLDLLAGRRETATWIRWSEVPIASWPLWAAGRTRPEERLLALGFFAEAAGAVGRQFPASDLPLAFTGAALLTRNEQAVRRGIALAEGLFERRPRDLPQDWVAPELRRILHPFPWAVSIRGHATAFRVDPALLAAVLREESRFDPRALSPAAARGLAQFTLPTAQRLAEATRFGNRVEPEDLYDPRVAIPLGAAYLGELLRRFPNAEPVAIAAYNAGEDQAALWRRNCLTAEPEEYLARIGFRETRAYVIRVLESRAIYEALYGTVPP